MSTNAAPVDGFLGDPAEALNPPASAGGCCGSLSPTSCAVTGAVREMYAPRARGTTPADTVAPPIQF